MIPQPFPPSPLSTFSPFHLLPFHLLPFHLLFLRLFLRTPLSSAACWLRCGFILCINPSFHTFRTPVPIVVYQPCPSPRSVPQKPLLCTNRVLHPVPYLGIPSRVPTVSSIPFRTSESPPVYQPCPSPRSVPQKPLLCTNRALHPVPYRRSPSRVPTVSLHPVPYRRSPSCVPTVPLTPFRTSEAPPCVPTVPLTPFRTAEAPPVYQPCPPSRSVPQKPLPCTNRAPYLVLCRESTFFEPNSAHYI